MLDLGDRRCSRPPDRGFRGGLPGLADAYRDVLKRRRRATSTLCTARWSSAEARVARVSFALRATRLSATRRLSTRACNCPRSGFVPEWRSSSRLPGCLRDQRYSSVSPARPEPGGVAAPLVFARSGSEATRGRPARRDSTPARSQQPRCHVDLLSRDRQRRGHRHRPRAPRADDPRTHVTTPLTPGAHDTARRAKR